MQGLEILPIKPPMSWRVNWQLSPWSPHSVLFSGAAVIVLDRTARGMMINRSAVVGAPSCCFFLFFFCSLLLEHKRAEVGIAKVS